MTLYICLLQLFILWIISITSSSTKMSELGNKPMMIIFPREGDSIVASSCDERTICSAKLYVAGIAGPMMYEPDLTKSVVFDISIVTYSFNGANEVSLYSDIKFRLTAYRDKMFPYILQQNVDIYFAASDFYMVHSFFFRDVDGSLLDNFNITTFCSFETLSYQPQLAAANIPPCPEGNCVMDYIEIGTSNFRSILHKVEELRDPSITSEISNNPRDWNYANITGISVEAINSYLVQLPNLINTYKVNVALAAEDNSIEYMYYIPERYIESIMTKNSHYYVLRGCSSIGGLHYTQHALMSQVDYPSAIVSRMFVPTVTFSTLLNYFRSLGYPRFRLIKLDLEGMDAIILRQMFELYSSELSDLKQWPCIIAYEMLDMIDRNYTMKTNTLLNSFFDLGYKLLDTGNIVESAKDLVLINCQCESYELIRSGYLLHDIQLSSIINICVQP